MSDLIIVALAGFAAALVDGALGMGFGPTSSTLLLSTGISPASVATTVNVAKVATGVVSGVSHWRLGNVDKRLALTLALPGVIGALIGTTILTSVDGDALRPVLAVLLVVVGLRILVRFSRPQPQAAADGGGVSPAVGAAARSPLTCVVAATGGTTNGLIGAWGPVVTPYLLQRGLPAPLVVGSVNAAEVAVALVSSASLLSALGRGGVDEAILLAMLLGGVVAAPLAAVMVRRVPPRLLGLGMAALLLGTQSRELASWLGFGRGAWAGTTGTVVGLVLAVNAWLVRRRRPVAAEPGPSASSTVDPLDHEDLDHEDQWARQASGSSTS